MMDLMEIWIVKYCGEMVALFLRLRWAFYLCYCSMLLKWETERRLIIVIITNEMPLLGNIYVHLARALDYYSPKCMVLVNCWVKGTLVVMGQSCLHLRDEIPWIFCFSSHLYTFIFILFFNIYRKLRLNSPDNSFGWTIQNCSYSKVPLFISSEHFNYFL